MHVLDTLGDPVRRRLVELFAAGERTAGDASAVIEEEFGISQPAVARHLRVLREGGFLTRRAAGRSRIYALDPAVLDEVETVVGRYRALWNQRLDALGTVSRHDDRFDLTFERVYATTVDDVWDACTNPDRLARWMETYRGDLRLGGRWEALDDGGAVRCRGTVTECEPPSRFVTTWEYEGEAPSTVTVTVATHPEGARLELRHQDLQDPGYGPGWQTYLEVLDESLGVAPSAVVDPYRVPGVSWSERYAELEPVWRPLLVD